MKTILMAIFFSILLAPFARAEEWYDKAEEKENYCMGEQYETHLSQLRAALKEHPESGLSHSELGICLSNAAGRDNDDYLFKKDRIDEAVAELRAAEKMGDDEPQVHTALADMLLRQMRYPDAEIEARRGAASKYHPLHSSYVGAHYDLVIALASQGKLDEALKTCDAALPKFKKDPRAQGRMHYLKSMLKLFQSDFTGAEAEARAGISADRSGQFGHAALFSALYRQKRFEDALAEARAVIEVGEKLNDPTGMQYAAMALRSLGRDDDALKNIELLEKADPGNWSVLLDKGLILKRRGDASADDMLRRYLRYEELATPDYRTLWQKADMALARKALGEGDSR